MRAQEEEEEVGWCVEVWKATAISSPLTTERLIHLPHLLTASIQFATMIVIIIFQWRAARLQRRYASSSSSDAELDELSLSAEPKRTRWVVLPIYATALWYLALADFMRALHNAASEITAEPRWMRLLGNAVVWVTWHTFNEGVALSLAQPSAGQLATRRCFLVSFGYSLLSGVTLTLLHIYWRREWAQLILFSMYLVFYVVLVAPTPRPCMFSGRRPALRMYAGFSALIACLRVTGILIALGYTNWKPSKGGGGAGGDYIPASAYSCGMLLEWTSEFIQCIGKPIITYWTFVVDSQYWMGLLILSPEEEGEGEKEDETSSRELSGNVRFPLTGLSLAPQTAHDVVMAGDRLHAHPHVLYVAPYELTLHSTLSSSSSFSAVGYFQKPHMVPSPAAANGHPGKHEHERTKKKKKEKLRPMASGGFARVYRGTWRGRQVAVKLLTRMVLLPEDVSAFVRDAESLAQLASIRLPVRDSSPVEQKISTSPSFSSTDPGLFMQGGNHTSTFADHALEFCGVCIWPPALALVLPLCEHGSLRDVLDRYDVPEKSTEDGVMPRSSSTEMMEQEPLQSLYVPLWKNNGGSSSDASVREAFSGLDECTRWRLALQCCRAVALLHAQQPPLVHLDIKSMNFLVAAATEDQFHRLRTPYVIKLADLDCAISEPDILALTSAGDSESIRPARPLRIPQTLYWSAPEVIIRQTRVTHDLIHHGADFGPITTRSDCYSLGMVLWEIGTVGFASSIPFSAPTPRFSLEVVSPEHKTQGHESWISSQHLANCICTKFYRPEIVPQMNRDYAALVTELWDTDAHKRPTAMTAAHRLEALILRHYGAAPRTPTSDTPLRSTSRADPSSSSPSPPSSPTTPPHDDMDRSF